MSRRKIYLSQFLQAWSLRWSAWFRPYKSGSRSVFFPRWSTADWFSVAETVLQCLTLSLQIPVWNARLNCFEIFRERRLRSDFFQVWWATLQRLQELSTHLAQIGGHSIHSTPIWQVGKSYPAIRASLAGMEAMLAAYSCSWCRAANLPWKKPWRRAAGRWA